jgi:hypothetical protein
MTKADPPATRELRAWISARHYLRSVPPGQLFILEFSIHRARCGAMLWGRPASRTLDPARTLQLHRMVFLEDAPKLTESHALAMARRYIRVHHPRVNLVITYCDPAEAHHGTIFLADGWAYLGHTRKHAGYGWRRAKPTGPIPPKTRWIRTP